MSDTYLLEKTIYVIKEQARLLELLKGTTPSTDELIEAIQGSAYRSLYDLTKIASDVSDSEWETKDRDLIKNDPKNGLEILLKRYGWITETTLERKKREILEFVEEVRKRLKDPSPSPNRTLFNEFLHETPFKGELVEDIKDRLERVNQGELPWVEFIEQTLSKLQFIEENASNLNDQLQRRLIKT